MLQVLMHSLLIIGCGSIGERHLRCFQKTGRCSLAVCDTNATLLMAMQERYGVPGFATLEEALAARHFDAAVICTPAHLHLPMALTLLAAGKHLLVEKPLALDVALIPATREAIARANAFFGVAYVYHFMPWVSEARGFLKKRQPGPRVANQRGLRAAFPHLSPGVSRDILCPP